MNISILFCNIFQGEMLIGPKPTNVLQIFSEILLKRLIVPLKAYEPDESFEGELQA